MKSSKRLLIGALVSAALCQSGVLAMSKKAKIGLGIVGGTFGTIAITCGAVKGLGYACTDHHASRVSLKCDCDVEDLGSNTIDYQAIIKNGIIDRVDEESYKAVLETINKGYVKIKNSVKSLELSRKNWFGQIKTVRLSGESVYRFFNGSKKISGFAPHNFEELIQLFGVLLLDGAKQGKISDAVSSDSYWIPWFNYSSDDNKFSLSAFLSPNEKCGLKICCRDDWHNQSWTVVLNDKYD